MTREQACFYLAGIIDGEGHVSCRESKHGWWERSIVIGNTDMALIQAVVECCEILELDYGIHTRTRQKKEWSACHVVKITGHDNLVRVLDEIPIRSPEKVRALALAVSNIQRVQLSGRQKRMVDALLSERVPTKEIAAQIGCDVRTIQYRKQKLARTEA